MKSLFIIVLAFMVNFVAAGDALIASGRKSFGVTFSYAHLLDKGNIPVVELIVDPGQYPQGIIPQTAKVEYLASVWGHCTWIPTTIRTSFVIYDDGNGVNAVARSPQGARAVAHAKERSILAQDGRAMSITDEATFKLDQYLPPGKYLMVAYIDVTGDGISESAVFPRGSYVVSPLDTRTSFVLTKDGRVDKTVTSVASLEYAPLIPKPTYVPAAHLRIENEGAWIKVEWSSWFPDSQLEALEIGSSQWTRTSTRPGAKQFIVDSSTPSARVYRFKEYVPFTEAGNLFRLVPGGLVEAIGSGLPFPVTQR